MVDGQITIKRPRANPEDCILVDGLHEAIIDEDIFNSAQKYMSQNRARPVSERNTVKNPLSGLVICGLCGRRMVRRPYSNYNDTLMCPATSCHNISSALHFVEERILDALKDWLKEYRVKWEIDAKPRSNLQIDAKHDAIKKINDELSTLDKQLNNLHDLLEQGIYTNEKFLERKGIITTRIEQNKEDQAALADDIALESIREDSRQHFIPKVEYLLELYNKLPTAKAKNDLLKEVLEKVVYIKDKNGRWHNQPDDFEIVLYPKLPQHTH